MREILFRGKEKNQWVSGYYWKYEQNGKEYHVIRDSADKLLKFNHICSPETLGQFTGLIDKSGVKIFEGDIIKSTRSGTIGKVGYYPEEGAFMVLFNISSGYCVEYLGDINMSTIEIIGNIYDNPELIEDGDANEEP